MKWVAEDEQFLADGSHSRRAATVTDRQGFNHFLVQPPFQKAIIDWPLTF